MTLINDCPHDLACDLLGLEHHGVTEIAFQQVGLDKAWTDIGKTYFQATGMSLLLQGL